MGLHNKFPSDFYRRGNLFNTYLGSGEESYRISSPKKPGWKPRPVKPTLPPEPHGHPQEALITFVQLHLTLEQMELWRKHTSAAHNVAFAPAKLKHLEVAAFIRKSIPPLTCARYLAELERRRAARSPLVRPNCTRRHDFRRESDDSPRLGAG